MLMSSLCRFWYLSPLEKRHISLNSYQDSFQFYSLWSWIWRNPWSQAHQHVDVVLVSLLVFVPLEAKHFSQFIQRQLPVPFAVELDLGEFLKPGRQTCWCSPWSLLVFFPLEEATHLSPFIPRRLSVLFAVELGQKESLKPRRQTCWCRLRVASGIRPPWRSDTFYSIHTKSLCSSIRSGIGSGGIPQAR